LKEWSFLFEIAKKHLKSVFIPQYANVKKEFCDIFMDKIKGIKRKKAVKRLFYGLNKIDLFAESEIILKIRL